MTDDAPRADDSADAAHPDTGGLRALAHPLRLRLLGLLRSEGPATATTLAGLTGESTGSTSYHLRQLAAHGFVVEDPERGNARDRWWRAANPETRTEIRSPSPGDPAGEEALAVGEQYLRLVADGYHTRVRAGIDRLGTLEQDLGAGWSDGFTMSDYPLRLTRQEAVDLVAALEALAETRRRDDPERRDEAPDGSERVVLQFQVIPEPPARRPAPEETS